MKRNVTRDVLIYSISFGFFVIIGFFIHNGVYLLDTSRIFYYLGLQMNWLMYGTAGVAGLYSIFNKLACLVLLAITIILPIVYIVYDSKKHERFRPINILWILFTIATFVYYILFITNINVKLLSKLTNFNDLMIICALLIFLLEAMLKIKEDWKNTYFFANIAIKVYLYLFMMIKAADLFILFIASASKTSFLSILINIFINVCYFLALYSLTRFFDRQKENAPATYKIMHIKHIKMYSAIILISTSASIVLSLLLSFFTVDDQLFQTAMFASFQLYTWITICLFVFAIIMQNILRKKILVETQNFNHSKTMPNCHIISTQTTNSQTTPSKVSYLDNNRRGN